MGDLLDHPELIIVSGIHDLLYLPLKLRPGMDNTVIDQVVYRDPQSIGNVDQCGQADPGRPSLNVAHVGRRHLQHGGEPVLCHVGFNSSNFDSFSNLV